MDPAPEGKIYVRVLVLPRTSSFLVRRRRSAPRFCATVMLWSLSVDDDAVLLGGYMFNLNFLNYCSSMPIYGWALSLEGVVTHTTHTHWVARRHHVVTASAPRPRGWVMTGDECACRSARLERSPKQSSTVSIKSN